jgi:hypothetical protein
MYSAEFITAKVVDLGLISFYYIVLALFFSVILNYLTRVYDRYTGDGDLQKEKGTGRLLFEVTANIFFVAVSFWIIRNIVERIPFPLDGFGGFQHGRLNRTSIDVIATLTLILFQTELREKINMLNERFFAAQRK